MEEGVKGYLFQYISCYSLSERKQFCRNCRLFQYISCYSLSEETIRTWDKAIEFQYISCYSLSEEASNFQNSNYSFNTSHVTLYLIRKLRYAIITWFQYISCYSLSIFRVPLWTPYCCFNTSHVTLYHEYDLKATGFSTGFQYISCYSLSLHRRKEPRESHVSIHLMLLFIEFVLQDVIEQF